MLNCWIIYPRYVSRHGDNAFGWLADEASAYDITVSVLFAEDITICYGGRKPTLIHKGCETTLPDVVLLRHYDSVLSRFFERCKIHVINSTASMELSKNKMLTHELLAAANLPTPLTIYREGGEYDYSELSSIFSSGTFIVKRTDGAKGEDVFLVDSADKMHNAIESCTGNCICQEFIAHSRGRDIRVWVIGYRAVAAVLRDSETSFLSNFSQGGAVKPFALTEQTARLAEESCRALGIEFAGVDLLFTPDGFTVNEINGNAGFRTLSKVGENIIPRELFSYINGVLKIESFKADKVEKQELTRCK